MGWTRRGRKGRIRGPWGPPHPEAVSKNHPVVAEKKELGPCHFEVSVTVPAARVREEFDHAIKAAARGVKVPGFRPGKVPAAVLRQMLGDGAEEHAREHLFDHCANDALAVVGLRNLVLRTLDFDPSDIEVDEEKDLEFAFEVETMPDVELPAFEEIEVEAQDPTPTEEQQAEALQGLAGNNPQFEEVEDGAVDADLLAEVNLVYLRGDEEGPKADGLKFALGSPLYGADPEAYDAALSGKKAGESFDLEVEFNEGFSEESWVGETGTARISVTKVVRGRPANAEEMVEAFGLKDVEELEERIRGRIVADNEQRERERQAHAALDAILELKPFQLSPRMIQEEAEASRKSNIERMQQQGATEEQATAEADKHADDMAVDAERRLKHWFILRRLAQQEKVRVSSRDLDNAFRAISQQQGVDVGMLKKFYKERNMTDNLRGEILESKVRAHLVDKLAELRQASLSAPLES